MNAPIDAPAISRRRIIQGAAWAAPVVLVATAVPAAAASLPGTITYSAYSANQDASVLTVSQTIAFSGATGAQPDHDVTGLTATIRVLTSRLTAPPTASTSSAGWVAVPPTTSGNYTIFSFVYGLAIGAGSPSAAPLVVTISKTSDVTAQSVDIQASGSSDGTTPQTSLVSIPVGAFAIMSFNYGPQASLNSPYAVVQGAILNEAGWPNFNSADVVGVYATVRVLTSATGSGTASVPSWVTTWAYDSVSTDGNATIYKFRLVAGTLPTSTNASSFVFNIPRAASQTTATPYVVTFVGTSPNASGATSVLTGTATI